MAVGILGLAIDPGAPDDAQPGARADASGLPQTAAAACGVAAPGRAPARAARRVVR